jgi:hypothetical protein
MRSIITLPVLMSSRTLASTQIIPHLRKVCTATAQLWQFPCTVQLGPGAPCWALNQVIYFRVPSLNHAVPMKRHHAEINKAKQIAIIQFPRRTSASVHISPSSTAPGGSSKGRVSEEQIWHVSQPPESRQEPLVPSWRGVRMGFGRFLVL